MLSCSKVKRKGTAERARGKAETNANFAQNRRNSMLQSIRSRAVPSTFMRMAAQRSSKFAGRATGRFTSVGVGCTLTAGGLSFYTVLGPKVC